MNIEKTPFERITNWISNSMTIKLITITVLMLLMLIPVSLIQSIVYERESLKNVASEEVSSKWAYSQTIIGPILTIPVVYEYLEKGRLAQITKNWHILPENLKIDGEINPEILKRGIYDVIVYNSNLRVSGSFKIDKKLETSLLKSINYDQAFITIGISDPRGIKKQIQFDWNGKKLEADPGSDISDLIYSGITIDSLALNDSLKSQYAFGFDLKLRGSESLSFTPVGNSTNVFLKSPWPDPSFNGAFLPDKREVSEGGFSSSWSVLQLNRNYPQTWVGEKYGEQIQSSAFGLKMIQPMDDYKKAERSAKYAAMTIALTFLIFFLVEILNKRRIHPFQYALVGLALCLFYTLLVSISEQSFFDFAYAISTLAIVTMIGLYSISVLRSRKAVILMVSALFGIYAFIFVTLRLTEFALLMGSILLTTALGLTMYYTRNVDWYNSQNQEKKLNSTQE